MGGEAVSLCSPTVGEAPTPLGGSLGGPRPHPKPNTAHRAGDRLSRFAELESYGRCPSNLKYYQRGQIHLGSWKPSPATSGWNSYTERGASGLFQLLPHSAFFTVQLSHPYITTRKTIALTRRTFVGKVMSLLLICCLGWS